MVKKAEKVFENSKEGYLLNYFLNNKARPIEKWVHYFDVYELYFEKYRNKPVNMLEIGVAGGGSMQMWKSYFGKKAFIFGVNIIQKKKELEEEQIKIFIGDQADRTFLKGLRQQLPKLDIILDDGGHTMEQQINTFEELWPHLKEGGVYICEDVHTSYQKTYNGGYRKASTFMEYSKNLTDNLNAYFSEDKNLKVNDFTNSIYSISFYDSMIAIVKSARRRAAYSLTTGNMAMKDRVLTRIVKTKKKLWDKQLL